MSVTFDESNYLILRNHDPSYQAMTRVSDANNIYDIRQVYIKTGSSRNDFETQLDKFDHNKGILNDGKAIDMTNFFTETQKVIVNGKESIAGINIPYFKFKTNHVLNFYTNSHIKDTYIDKTNVESIFDIVESTVDSKTIYGIGNKHLEENSYNSYPLQRVDKLVINELDSLFIYVDGKKIPDNRVFVYTNQSFTDVFIPQDFIPGKISATDSIIDTVFTIDYRQPGSEGFYFFDKIYGNSIDIDLTDSKYKYAYTKKKNKDITTDKLLMFVDGYLEKVKSVEVIDNILHIEFNSAFNGNEIELYIMNNVVYRYKVPVTSMLNLTGSKVHFYLPDNYYADVISGPITKNAVSFWYDGVRVDDSKIVQTSRFSFEYTIDQYTYKKVSIPSSLRAIPGQSYYTRDSKNNYVLIGELSYFDPEQIYYTKESADSFDETKIDFIIEDIGFKIDESTFKTYGDDYYLLNMIGVKRCVDKMKGTLSYSIFDDNRYQISFKDVLSNDGNLFDLPKAINKYNFYAKHTHSPEHRIKNTIKERPTLLRKLLEQVKVPSKRLIVLGNANDVTISSVEKLADPDLNIYYKIYINHKLIDDTKYKRVRENNYDLLTISKDILEPLVQNEDGSYKSGSNEIEIFQYDLSYQEKLIFKDNLNNGFDEYIEPNGEHSYVKTYRLENLPFLSFLNDDLCAIERIEKKWFDSTQQESSYLYPTNDQIGYRMIKLFEILEKTDETLTVKIQLHDYLEEHTNKEFFMLIKQYNVAETIVFKNEDHSYMATNDLLIPVYSTYVEYAYEDGEKKIKSLNKYIPYINTSEPIITCNGKEMIFGKDYTYENPETNDSLTSSFIILKSQLNEGDIITVQFNSNKTNILIVGYDDLNIDNRYGLLYLSELKYPVSTEYMNIFINGEKLSAYDIDILSDKLIRVHHITRPIKSVLITTNMLYKESELKDYLELYQETEFEKLLEEIFWNCDPSKIIDSNRPNIDYVYKVNPYYSEFVGEKESEYDNQYYKDIIETIIENKNNYDSSSVFSNLFLEPEETEDDYELKHEAWENANKFFTIYRNNHGFVEDVDSIKQAENPYSAATSSNFITDTLELMYMNWLCKSGKTRAYNYKSMNIDPLVLKYFSVFENVIINNRVDIVVDSNRFYDGMIPDANNPPLVYDYIKNTIKVLYPGACVDTKKKFFFEILLETLESRKDSDELCIDPNTGRDALVQAICNHKLSNILYPGDFPLEANKNGIMKTGTNVDIVNFGYDDMKAKVEAAKTALQNILNKE